MIARRRFLLIAAAACASGPVKAVTRERFIALGAQCEIALAGDPLEARASIAACREEVETIEAAFSLYRPDSALSRLNREGALPEPGVRFRELLAHIDEINAISSGGFEPGVQARFLGAADAPGWNALAVDKSGVRFTQPGMALTFNGVAQGYAADRVAALLAARGHGEALANLGEFRGAGRGWRIGVATPDGRIARTIRLDGGAVATSAPRTTLIRGAAHILDPLSRKGPRWASVTVLADEGWRADALSTAIAAAPTREADALLREGGAHEAFLFDTENRLRRWRG